MLDCSEMLLVVSSFY